MCTVTGNVRADIHWIKALCKEPGNYIGWPTVARKADGELLVVFSGDRDAHLCPYGKMEMVRSQDVGETWSKPETINNTPLDDRDAGIIVLRSGTIVVSWFTSRTGDRVQGYRERYGASVVDAWERHCRKITEQDRQRWLGHWTRRSTDGGDTWEPEVESIASSNHGPIELQDGRLLYVGTADIADRPALVSVESTDEARSWDMIGTIPVPDLGGRPFPYAEPHVVEMADGRLVCLIRYRPVDSSTWPTASQDWHMRQTESTDGGRTWTVAHPTPIWGYPPHLIRLSNGDVLASYGYRQPPYGQRACVSHDGGQAWDIENRLTLSDDAFAPHHGDMGYPASIELEPGELLTVYYQIEYLGEKPSLMATRWSLEQG